MSFARRFDRQGGAFTAAHPFGGPSTLAPLARDEQVSCVVDRGRDFKVYYSEGGGIYGGVLEGGGGGIGYCELENV